jgi:hypothetical protein
MLRLGSVDLVKLVELVQILFVKGCLVVWLSGCLLGCLRVSVWFAKKYQNLRINPFNSTEHQTHQPPTNVKPKVGCASSTWTDSQTADWLAGKRPLDPY